MRLSAAQWRSPLHLRQTCPSHTAAGIARTIHTIIHNVLEYRGLCCWLCGSSSRPECQPLMKLLRHLQTFDTSMHHTPYARSNWQWIQTAVFFFSAKSRITARNSNLTYAFTGSSMFTAAFFGTEVVYLWVILKIGADTVAPSITS